MEYPKFKVCCRCFTFNQAKYVTETMNGFTMQQTSFPFVCTIVDDASTDGEQKVIKDYIVEHFNLQDSPVSFEKDTDYAHIIFAQHKTNQNCYFAVLLLKENLYSQKQNYKKFDYIAEWRDKCEYEAPCEGDDYWIVLDKLEKQVQIMDNNPNISLVHSNFFFLEENTDKLIEHKTLECSSKKDVLINIIDGNKYRIQTMTTLFRLKDYYKVIQSDDFLYNSCYFLMGDTQLWTGLLTIGDIYCINTPTSVYRINSGSVSNQNDLQKKYRFSLSCSELRLYLLNKYNLSDCSVHNVITKQYNENLLFYKLFNPKFTPIFSPQFPYSIIWSCLYAFRLNIITCWRN